MAMRFLRSRSKEQKKKTFVENERSKKVILYQASQKRTENPIKPSVENISSKNEALYQPSQKRTENPIQVMVNEVRSFEDEELPSGMPRKVVVLKEPSNVLPRPRSSRAEMRDDFEYDDTSTIATGITTEYTTRTYTLVDALNEVVLDTTYMSSLMCREVGKATDYIIVEHISPIFGSVSEKEEKETSEDPPASVYEPKPEENPITRKKVETSEEAPPASVDEPKPEENPTTRKKVIKVQPVEDETCAALEVGFDGSRHAIVATSNGDDKQEPSLFSWAKPLLGEHSKTVVDSVDFVRSETVPNIKEEERKIGIDTLDPKEATVSIESLLAMKGRIAEIKEVQKRRFQNLTGITNEDEEENSLYKF